MTATAPRRFVSIRRRENTMGQAKVGEEQQTSTTLTKELAGYTVQIAGAGA